MRKKKGVALPTAVALCSIMLIVAATVSGIIVAISLTNRSNRQASDNEMEFLKAYEIFVASDGEDVGFLGSNFDYVKYTSTEVISEHTVSALVAYTKETNIVKYYSIYDFTGGKTLAYQTKNLYIPSDSDNYYIGGLIPVEKETYERSST